MLMYVLTLSLLIWRVDYLFPSIWSTESVYSRGHPIELYMSRCFWYAFMLRVFVCCCLNRVVNEYRFAQVTLCSPFTSMTVVKKDFIFFLIMQKIGISVNDAEVKLFFPSWWTKTLTANQHQSCLQGIHPEMKMLPLITHPHVVPNP